MKSPSTLRPFTIGLCGTCFVLIAVLRIGLDPRSFGVAILVAAVGAGELAIDIDDDVGLGRSGTASVARKNAGTGGRNHFGFLGGEKAQRHFHRAVLSLQAQRLARQTCRAACPPIAAAGRVKNSRRFISASPDA